MSILLARFRFIGYYNWFFLLLSCDMTFRTKSKFSYDIVKFILNSKHTWNPGFFVYDRAPSVVHNIWATGLSMRYFVWVTVFLLNEICLYVKDGSPASTRSSSPKLDWMIKRGMVGVNFKTCPGFTLVSPFHTLCLLVLFIQFWFTLLWSGLGHFLALVVQLLK